MKMITCPGCLGKGRIPDPVTFCADMRRQRQQLGLTLQEVARAMGISFSYLSDLETARRPWNQDLINRFEKAIN